MITPNRSGSQMERLLFEIKKVIVGQDHLLERLIVALLARGHVPVSYTHLTLPTIYSV